jgi:beta-xylosidase
MFQKSTDAGRTWLPADVLIRRGSSFATNPDVTTDLCGNIYIVYTEFISSSNSHNYCVRSSDGGVTWTPPVKVDDDTELGIGWARTCADSAGNLLCAWNDDRTGRLHIWSSVSTDRGATWSRNVRVDDDTVNDDCYDADVFVQPGTNHYLVAASVPHSFPRYTAFVSDLYRSTDMGQTFEPGVRLDTFSETSEPHVVADAQHIICDYTGESEPSGQEATEARTFYTPPDTWGNPFRVTDLDTLYDSYYNGAKLAISADGRVHTALMICRTTSGHYRTYYAFSSDHGVSWSERVPVNDDSTAESWDPDLAADSAGCVYVVWQDWRSGSGRIWFATNNPAAIAEQPTQQRIGEQPSATVVRNVLFLAERPSSSPSASYLLDIGGRQVMALKPGANDVSRLSPGVYFFCEEPQAASRKLQAVRKIVITK